MEFRRLLIGASAALCTAIALIYLAAATSVVFSQGEADRRNRVITNDDFPSSTSSAPQSETHDHSPDNPATSSRGPVGRVAPFVATPLELVERMLSLAQVSSSDVVYDLGSGDGRIVIAAAGKYGARAVGVELDRDLARASQAVIENRGLAKLAKIVQGDLFETDVSPATVVTVYLLQAANRKLSPILEKDLKSGTRVVAHDIRIPDWRPVEEVSVTAGGVQHFIYLYRVPESFRK